MMVLIRFWRSLIKKDSVESAKYEFFSTFTPVLGLFFGSRFFRIGSELRKTNSDPDLGKNLDPKHCQK